MGKLAREPILIDTHRRFRLQVISGDNDKFNFI